MARVQQHVDTFQYEEARKWCSRAVTTAPEDADIRYLMGTICLELGDFHAGLENIQVALQLRPDAPFDRYFALAQLLPGRDALQVYEHGLRLFQEQQRDGSQPAPSDRRKVSTACCAAAELFMTDLCDEEGAETQCGQWTETARQTDPTNPEVYRVMADLKMCQEQPTEARDCILESVRLWDAELSGLLVPADERPLDEILTEFPSYESRIAAAKILIELGQEDLYSRAVTVLEQLLKEDDSVLMTWYLLCLALKMAPPSASSDVSGTVLRDALEGALRVARREGLLQYPELTSSDDLVVELLAMAAALQMPLDDLDRVEEDGDVTDDETGVACETAD